MAQIHKSFPVVQDTYRTQPVKVSWFARHFPSCVFYRAAFRAIWKASGEAKRGLYTDEKWILSSGEIVRAIESVGGIVEVENVSAFRNLNVPCVFIGNHMSTLETFVLPSIIQPHRNVTLW